jgi:hypothetical protein
MLFCCRNLIGQSFKKRLSAVGFWDEGIDQERIGDNP